MMLLKHKFKKLVSVISVCAILFTGVGSQTYAAVNDNVINASVEQSLGSSVNKDFPTVFDFLQNIWDKLDDITVALNNIERKVDRQTATAGGGCYYTVYTNKSYLDGYKLKLYDGTSAKSCYIGYDPDSEYWCGVVRVPLNNNITIEIFDQDTGISQGKMATSTVTTSGYATINLDPLLDGIYASVLDINDSLATLMYQQTYYTQNSTWLPTIVAKLVVHDEHLPDFMQSSSDLTIESDSFATLYSNRDEFLSCVNSTVGDLFLNNVNIGKHVANTRQLLRWIIDNDNAVAKCENNSTFCSYLQNTTLPLITVSGTTSQGLSVSGSLLCTSIVSGCIGAEQSTKLELYYGSLYYAGQQGSLRGKTTLTLHDNTSILMDTSSAYYCAVYNGTWNSFMSWNSPPGSSTVTNKIVSNKFANRIIIEGYPDTTYGNYRYNYFDYYYITPALPMSQVVAPSITYIDLDAEG